MYSNIIHLLHFPMRSLRVLHRHGGVNHYMPDTWRRWIRYLNKYYAQEFVWEPQLLHFYLHFLTLSVPPKPSLHIREKMILHVYWNPDEGMCGAHLSKTAVVQLRGYFEQKFSDPHQIIYWSMTYCWCGRVCCLVKLRISMIRTFSFWNISHITLYAQFEIVWNVSKELPKYWGKCGQNSCYLIICITRDSIIVLDVINALP